VLVTARTMLSCLKLFSMSFAVFSRRVVDLTTLATFESNVDSHLNDP